MGLGSRAFEIALHGPWLKGIRDRALSDRGALAWAFGTLQGMVEPSGTMDKRSDCFGRLATPRLSSDCLGLA
eukprot:12409864-Karenia_brevis.AAC.1